MGSCCSWCFGESLTPAERARRLQSKEIDNRGRDDYLNDSQTKKLLLLGAGESGKSTLFKQMITLYGKGYSIEDRKGFTNIVYNNTIAAIKTIAKYSNELDADCRVTEDTHDCKRFVEELQSDAEINEEVAQQIKRLWNDPGIQATYSHRSKYQLPDSASYFFGRLDEIAQETYIPDQQDVLRSRVRTTGIVETTFEIEANRFKMFDVGGQRNERKKWIHCFEAVTAVIFVAAISEYDQVLYEDETTNRMHEALNLFDEICNSRWFRETSMILFLNKRDLFVEKIQKVPLTTCFPEYIGPQEATPNEAYESGCKFLRSQFENKNRSKEKEIYSHVTCATDTNNVQHVFNAVKDIIIRKSLREGGLM